MEQMSAVDKAVELLFHLHRAPDAQGVTRIGRALGLPKSSAHRLLAALGRRGLVERDPRGRYAPGIGLVALGLGALQREPAVVAARSVLAAEADALGETVFLVGARGDRLVVLDKVEGTGFLRAAPQVGSSVPVHATAVGKLFLAHAGDEIALPAGPLPRFTERTRADARGLAAEVALARERGFAENREEWIPGLWVVAAPVLVRGRILAAVAVAASVPRMESLGSIRVARRVQGAAGRIASRLEGTAP